MTRPEPMGVVPENLAGVVVGRGMLSYCWDSPALKTTWIDQGTQRKLVWLMQHEQREVRHEVFNYLFPPYKGRNQNPKQESADCADCVVRAKSILPPIFVVLLERSHAHSLTYWLRLLSCYKQKLPQRPCGLQSLNYLLPSSLQNKFAGPCITCVLN